MIAFIIGFLVSLFSTLIGTPILIRVVHRLNYGQYIRQDGPQSHLVKRGTPTMGGVVIVLSIILGWLVSAIVRHVAYGTPYSFNAVLVLFVMLAMGVLGFIDDFAKVRKKQNEGLSIHGKLIGQIIIATVFAILVLVLPQHGDATGARAGITWIDDTVISFESLGRVGAIVLYVVWVNFLLAAWTNAFNLTDGLDGLCTGNSMIAFIAYAFVAFWEANHIIGQPLHEGYQYSVTDPTDLAIIAGCACAACFGFLWYNANPALIFMGDTGSLALGGLFSALSIATHTELLAAIIGGLFVIEAMSDVIQISAFKIKHVRVFKMAPIHHHFELCGWPEGKVVVRFWMIEAMFGALGVLCFYSDWLLNSHFLF
ncbi:MAG: phospho-N-acetylmuramoyl-pentapeptide-transferase [Bifidobacteriaceae bacterium]|nr:phospho-N-acetylmuramoyl-pentapeptide-transferase [Bifidobacteriaceae bacterium]